MLTIVGLGIYSRCHIVRSHGVRIHVVVRRFGFVEESRLWIFKQPAIFLCIPDRSAECPVLRLIFISGGFVTRIGLVSWTAHCQFTIWNLSLVLFTASPAWFLTNTPQFLTDVLSFAAIRTELENFISNWLSCKWEARRDICRPSEGCESGGWKTWRP